MEQERSEELEGREAEDRAQVRVHQVFPNGYWECPAVGKHTNVFSTNKGLMVCGHCLKPLRRRDGSYVPWHIGDHMAWVSMNTIDGLLKEGWKHPEILESLHLK